MKPDRLNLVNLACIFLLLAPHASVNAAQSIQDVWQSSLKQHFFADREIHTDTPVITLEAPSRAEDPSLVPIRIRAAFAQTEQRFIKEITLIIDRNPDPKAGVFRFGPESGRADLELRLRVDQYSHIRAIARTNDNKLHMVSQYVKASGGCSAPSTANLEAAMQRLGKVRLQTNKVEHDGPALVSAQLRISHPNTTGMQRNQMTQLVYPAHFVRQVRVTLDGVEIFSADVGISISENPSFRFYLRDTDPRSLGAGGELIAEVFDSKENRFVKTAVLSQGS